MRNIIVEDFKQTPLEKQRMEIVERKGRGHPDHICDAVADRISVDLCKEYIEKTGAILHHNIDKSLLVAGETSLKFNGGTVKQPILFVLGDRATTSVDGKKIDVKEIAIKAAKNWLKKNLRLIDPEEHVRYQVEIKPGAVGLTDIFKRKGKVLGANDTSAAVGYAPMTKTEKIVLQTEKYVNSDEFKRKFPESGEDVKVMAFRDRNGLKLTVAMAFVDKYISSEQDYFDKKEKILEKINTFAAVKSNFDQVDIKLNTLDMKGRGIGGLYLTVLGTSADNGDSGQVGRGNRVNGLISLNRPFCSEAAAGKNPVSHVGKIYNFLTFRIAEKVYREVKDLDEVYIWLLSKIGSPIDHPAVAAAQVVTKGDSKIGKVKQRISEILEKELENIEEFCMELAEGKLSPC